METRDYRVDSRMIPPVVLAMISGFALLLLEGPTQRGFLLIIILIPFFYLGAEILSRRITVAPEGLTIRKFLRTVRVEWPDIESLDAIKSGNKLFLILTTSSSRPIIVTNTIYGFRELADAILGHVPGTIVSGGAKQILEQTPSKLGPVVQAWIVSVVLAGVLIGRIAGYGS